MCRQSSSPLQREGRQMQGSVERAMVAIGCTCEMIATGARSHQRCMDGALGSIHRDTGKGRRSGDTVF